MAIYSKECNGCGKNIQGFPMCVWQGRLKAKFECGNCGTVSEYVDVEQKGVVKVKD